MKFILPFLIFVISTNSFADCNMTSGDLRSKCLSECGHLNRSNEKFDSFGDRLEANRPYQKCSFKYVSEALKDVELPEYDPEYKNPEITEAIERIEKAVKEEKKQKAEIEKEKKKREKKAAKIREKCAKKAKDYKNESAAQDAIAACLHLEGYWD